jgi:hypothetical protein
MEAIGSLTGGMAPASNNVLGVIIGNLAPMAESQVTVIDALTDWRLGAAVKAYQVVSELGLTVPMAVNRSTQNRHDLTLRIEE